MLASLLLQDKWQINVVVGWRGGRRCWGGRWCGGQCWRLSRWDLTSPEPVDNSSHHLCAVCQVCQSLQGPAEEDCLIGGTIIADGVVLARAIPTERRGNPSPTPIVHIISIEITQPAVGRGQIVGAQSVADGVATVTHRVRPVHVAGVAVNTQAAQAERVQSPGIIKFAT